MNNQLIEKYNKETIKFVGSKPYVNAPLDEYLTCSTENGKELVVICSDRIKSLLNQVDTEYFIPMLDEYTSYLDKLGYDYTIDLSNAPNL